MNNREFVDRSKRMSKEDIEDRIKYLTDQLVDRIISLIKISRTKKEYQDLLDFGNHMYDTRKKEIDDFNKFNEMFDLDTSKIKNEDLSEKEYQRLQELMVTFKLADGPALEKIKASIDSLNIRDELTLEIMKLKYEQINDITIELTSCWQMLNEFEHKKEK